MTATVPTIDSPAALADSLRKVDYLADDRIAQVAFLADRLGKPILVEGPTGVGKTELAKSLARMWGRRLIRLQCYEGLDESKALYEWNYKKQLLRIQADHDKEWDELEDDIFSDEFLLARPLSRIAPRPRSSSHRRSTGRSNGSPAAEVLSDFQVSTRAGTIRLPPGRSLYSNNTK